MALCVPDIRRYLSLFGSNDFSDYSVEFERGPGPSRLFDLHLRGSENIELFAGSSANSGKKRILAVCGYTDEGSTRIICQMKGADGAYPWLCGVRWQKALIEYACDIPAAGKISEVRVVSSRAHPDVLAGYVPQERAYRNLDLPAQQLGFAPQPSGHPAYWFRRK